MYIYRLHSDLRSLATILLLVTYVFAGPYPKDNLADIGFSYLLARNCASYCGAQSQYCCAAGEACFTNEANIAFCSSAVPAWGGYAVYTTTYTETNLVLHTSTYTSSWGPATPTCNPAATTWNPDPIVTSIPTCTSSLGESSCGNICCANDQRCAFSNSCTAHSPAHSKTATISTFDTTFRPTSGDDSTISVTTTEPFQPPATASGSLFPVAPSYNNHSLSGGAIAGIVIGVMAGIALLLLFCFSCAVIVRKNKDSRNQSSSSDGSSEGSFESSQEEKTTFMRKMTTLFCIKGSSSPTRPQRKRSPRRQPSIYASSRNESSISGSSHNSQRVIDPTDLSAPVQVSENYSKTTMQNSRKTSKRGFKPNN